MLIDRNSGSPLYIQLKRILITKLDNGDYKPGALIPTEAELEQKYSLSRTTVRNALKELEFEGYVLRYPGKGTIVSHKKNVVTPRKLMSYSEEMKNSGLSPSSKVLSIKNITPSKYIKRKLQLSKDGMVWEVRRLKYASGIPMAIDLCYISSKIVTDLSVDLIEKNSMFDIYNNAGYTPTRANEILSARLPNKKESTLLDIPQGVPLFVVTRTTYHNLGEYPLEYVITCFRSDRYQYNVEI